MKYSTEKSSASWLGRSLKPLCNLNACETLKRAFLLESEICLSCQMQHIRIYGKFEFRLFNVLYPIHNIHTSKQLIKRIHMWYICMKHIHTNIVIYSIVYGFLCPSVITLVLGFMVLGSVNGYISVIAVIWKNIVNCKNRKRSWTMYFIIFCVFVKIPLILIQVCSWCS